MRNVGNESRYNDNGVNEILYGESGGVEKHRSLKLIFVATKVVATKVRPDSPGPRTSEGRGGNCHFATRRLYL